MTLTGVVPGRLYLGKSMKSKTNPRFMYVVITCISFVLRKTKSLKMFMSEFELDISLVLACLFDRIEPRECLKKLSFEKP